MLRNDCAPIIFDLPSRYFESSFTAKRITIPEIQTLIGYNAAAAAASGEPRSKAYARFPPALYRNNNTSRLEGRFLSKNLFRVRVELQNQFLCLTFHVLIIHPFRLRVLSCLESQQ